MSTEPGPPPRVGRRSDPPVPRTGRPLLQVALPHPFRALFVIAWPMMLLVMLLALAFAAFFPALGALLWFAMLPVVVGAFLLAGWRSRGVTLTVTDELVRVANGATGFGCERTQVASALVVASIKRRLLAPPTTDLILLDGAGRTAMLLSGRLWPVAVLEQVIELIAPPDVQRLAGRQTLASLEATFPRILEGQGGVQRPRSGRQIGLLVALGVLLGAGVLVAFLVFRG